jgi:hypothetical protein
MSNGTIWTSEEEAIFETSLAYIPETDPLRWQKIAQLIPAHTVDEVWRKLCANTTHTHCSFISE